MPEVDDRIFAERYRLYRLRGGRLRCLATAPDAAGIGQALVTQAEEGAITADDRVGLLDVFPDRKLELDMASRSSGRWLVTPWAKG